MFRRMIYRNGLFSVRIAKINRNKLVFETKNNIFIFYSKRKLVTTMLRTRHAERRSGSTRQNNGFVGHTDDR